jgi:hypothetical protein
VLCGWFRKRVSADLFSLVIMNVVSVVEFQNVVCKKLCFVMFSSMCLLAELHV